MKKETEFMKRLLPNHYTCEPRDNGVYCYSNFGIDENDPEHWEYIFLAIKQEFKERFMEVFHQTCSDHLEFTVFLRKKMTIKQIIQKNIILFQKLKIQTKAELIKRDKYKSLKPAE